jgi:hypothetical protein
MVTAPRLMFVSVLSRTFGFVWFVEEQRNSGGVSPHEFGDGILAKGVIIVGDKVRDDGVVEVFIVRRVKDEMGRIRIRSASAFACRSDG